MANYTRTTAKVPACVVVSKHPKQSDKTILISK